MATCFKNPNNPSCKYLLLTNQANVLESATIIETGLVDFHKMVIIAMKIYNKKQKARIIQ